MISLRRFMGENGKFAGSDVTDEQDFLTRREIHHLTFEKCIPLTLSR
jgi:hypothetical protein